MAACPPVLNRTRARQAFGFPDQSERSHSLLSRSICQVILSCESPNGLKPTIRKQITPFGSMNKVVGTFFNVISIGNTSIIIKDPHLVALFLDEALCRPRFVVNNNGHELDLSPLSVRFLPKWSRNLTTRIKPCPCRSIGRVTIFRIADTIKKGVRLCRPIRDRRLICSHYPAFCSL